MEFAKQFAVITIAIILLLMGMKVYVAVRLTSDSYKVRLEETTLTEKANMYNVNIDEEDAAHAITSAHLYLSPLVNSKLNEEYVMSIDGNKINFGATGHTIGPNGGYVVTAEEKLTYGTWYKDVLSAIKSAENRTTTAEVEYQIDVNGLNNNYVRRTSE